MLFDNCTNLHDEVEAVADSKDRYAVISAILKEALRDLWCSFHMDGIWST